MQSSAIETGKEYALREPRGPNQSLQRVRVIEHTRGSRWKVEWIDPNPGLTDYVDSGWILIPWKDHKALLRDEENKRQFREYNVREGFVKDSPFDNLLSEVFENTGESDLSYYRGTLSGKREALERVKARAGIAADETFPYSYTDRHGQLHVPYPGALKIAKAFCMKEPSAVLAHVEATEREWGQQVSRPGKEYLVGLLNQYRASWAIIRQWAGHDAAVAQREKYIERLERLVWDAIYALQRAGADSEAARLRKAISRD